MTLPASGAPAPTTKGAAAPITTMGPSGEQVVLVRFVLVAKGAKRVAVAGNFNGWSPEETVLQKADGSGLFVATVPLPRGAHEYMFVVDGEWVTDPAAPEVRPDGFGRSNAILRL
jgi:1,4-alpha-glucan branching enzyme